MEIFGQPYALVRGNQIKRRLLDGTWKVETIQPTVQMKAAYFEEPKEEPLPKIDTVDEMARKLLARVQGVG